MGYLSKYQRVTLILNLFKKKMADGNEGATPKHHYTKRGRPDTNGSKNDDMKSPKGKAAKYKNKEEREEREKREEEKRKKEEEEEKKEEKRKKIEEEREEEEKR